MADTCTFIEVGAVAAVARTSEKARLPRDGEQQSRLGSAEIDASLTLS